MNGLNAECQQLRDNLGAIHTNHSRKIASLEKKVKAKGRRKEKREESERRQKEREEESFSTDS